LKSKTITEIQKFGFNKLPTSWEVDAIENLPLQLIDGDRGKNYPKQHEFHNRGHCLFLNTKNVPRIKFDFSECQFIDKEKDIVLGKGKLQRNDIVITTRGTIGNSAFYDNEVPFSNIRINSGMVILRGSEKFDNYFLYVLFRSPFIKRQIQSFLTGTATPQLPIRDIKKLVLIFPPYPSQVKIGKLFSHLDRSIDTLEKQNIKLEQIAKAIFKSWFIDFDGQKQFVDSEFGEIPKGWKVAPIKELGKIVTGKTPPTKDKENFGYDYPFITIRDMHDSIFVVKSERYISKLAKSKLENYILPPLSVCISCIATPGLVSLTTTFSLTNQQINSIICDDIISPFFVYFTMKEIKKEIIQHASGGTATPNLNKGDFSEIKILLPSIPSIKKYHISVKPIFEKISENLSLISNLNFKRDFLTPKLISGEIQV